MCRNQRKKKGKLSFSGQASLFTLSRDSLTEFMENQGPTAQMLFWVNYSSLIWEKTKKEKSKFGTAATKKIGAAPVKYTTNLKPSGRSVLDHGVRVLLSGNRDYNSTLVLLLILLSFAGYIWYAKVDLTFLALAKYEHEVQSLACFVSIQYYDRSFTLRLRSTNRILVHLPLMYERPNPTHGQKKS
ncbi:hypothetical protein GALMADRAFT_213730 [Galerina marginata CBS 339.88]|uniref:Uncharacterized protein n=1 Tax=Galerina marginata (strain CBS 339.88) TaxID=685588 RepID=A0A067SLU8_GALM3|nr:hypothetical protein GALMADRAFT_213730 [Galerina marginata CBS 339.88]